MKIELIGYSQDVTITGEGTTSYLVFSLEGSERFKIKVSNETIKDLTTEVVSRNYHREAAAQSVELPVASRHSVSLVDPSPDADENESFFTEGNGVNHTQVKDADDDNGVPSL